MQRLESSLGQLQSGGQRTREEASRPRQGGPQGLGGNQQRPRMRRPAAEIQCYGCSETGHFLRDCPHSQGNGQVPTRQSTHQQLEQPGRAGPTPQQPAQIPEERICRIGGARLVCSIGGVRQVELPPPRKRQSKKKHTSPSLVDATFQSRAFAVKPPLSQGRPGKGSVGCTQAKGGTQHKRAARCPVMGPGGGDWWW